jgi:hypothetical protein
LILPVVVPDVVWEEAKLLASEDRITLANFLFIAMQDPHNSEILVEYWDTQANSLADSTGG